MFGSLLCLVLGLEDLMEPQGEFGPLYNTLNLVGY